jgi:hypothetical protein
MTVVSGGLSGCERYLGPALPHRALAHALRIARARLAGVNSYPQVRRCQEMTSRYTSARVAAWLRRAHRPDHPRVPSAADWTGLPNSSPDFPEHGPIAAWRRAGPDSLRLAGAAP